MSCIGYRLIVQVIKQDNDVKINIIQDRNIEIPQITFKEYLGVSKTHLVSTRTRVPQNLVTFAIDQSIEVEGTVEMKLAGGRRQLKKFEGRALKTGASEPDEDNEASFQLSIDLVPDDDAGDGASVLAGSAGAAAASWLVLGGAYAAVAAFVL